MVNFVLGSGPILLGVLILLGKKLNWPDWTTYLWAGIAIVFGIFLLL